MDAVTVGYRHVHKHTHRRECGWGHVCRWECAIGAKVAVALLAYYLHVHVMAGQLGEIGMCSNMDVR